MTSEEFKKRLEKFKNILPGDSPYLKTYRLTIKSKNEGENIFSDHADCAPNICFSTVRKCSLIMG